MKYASGKKKTAVAAAPKAKKSQPKNSAKTIKTVVKKAVVLTAPSESKKKKPTVSIAESKNGKSKLSAAGKKAKPVAGKTRRISARAVKTVKPEISAKKNGAAAKLRTTHAVKKMKSAAPKSIVSIKKSAKQQQTTAVIKKSKTAKIQPTASAAKKSKSAKSAISIRGKVKNAPAKKSAANVSAGKDKSVKLRAVVPAKKTKSAKSQTTAAAKKAKKPEPKIFVEKKKTARVQPGASTKENKIERRKIKPTVFVQAAKIKRAVKAESEIQGEKIFAAIKIRRQKIDFSPKKTQAVANKFQPSGNGKAGKIRSENRDKTVVNKIKALESAVVQKPKKRKAKAIGAAVFRGRKERYDFQVFPLDSEFDALVSGIYVISKRKTDRNKRAHHALVCIGQTDSVAGEIKRHAKKCIKKHQANVISILLEASEKRRLKIEEDLKSAHSLACAAG